MDSTAHGMPVVSLSGELNAANFANVQRHLGDITTPCIIDLTGVKAVDAAILGALIGVARRTGVRATVLVTPAPTVRRILQMAHFDQIFRLADTLDEAQRAIAA
jgi:anti-anti-sigma factor